MDRESPITGYKARDQWRSMFDSAMQASWWTPVRGEVALWRAVILQAMVDAVGKSTKSEQQYFRAEARRWLNECGRDFHMVCDYAALEPGYVRKRAKRALLNGCKWRAEPGQGRNKWRVAKRRAAEEK